MIPRIVAAGTAVPQYRYAQRDLLEMSGRDRLRETFFLNSDIDYRHLYFPPGFQGVETIDEMLDRGRKGAAELGGRAILRCLENASAGRGDVDYLSTATCTVSLCPQLDTIFIRDLDLSPSVRRAHIGDTGCAAAMVAIQAAADHLRAYPQRKAVAASVEMCSAALYRDGSVEAALGEAIFADGAAALFLSCEGTGFEIVALETLILSEHIDVTGFSYPGGWRRLVLAKELPAVGAEALKTLTQTLIEKQGLKKSDIRFWILHSAGRKVLDRAADSLELKDEDLRFSRDVFRNYGNMSSATVLFVLNEVMTSGLVKPGDWALMASMGAGFAAEGALLRWAD